MAKKKVVMKCGLAERRSMVGKCSSLSIAEQCGLVGIHRSGFYYVGSSESDENLEAMKLMDAWFLEHPHSGVITMCMYLCLDKGFTINIKRVRRLMRLMGLMAIYPGKSLSVAGKGHKIYPYLLRGLKIERKNQVWATDITYVPMQKGFMYMMAVIDVKTRFILNWSISNTMDGDWCKTVLEETIAKHGCPEIFNTDQGSQFTAHEFTQVLAGNGIRISMDGKGRALDNIFIERFWRSLKYEHVYLWPADDGLALYTGIRQYIHFYNRERRHQSLDKLTPQQSYQQIAA